MDIKENLWCNLRTSCYLLGHYMKAKYLDNQHQKVICEVKSLAEKHIYYPNNEGHISIKLDIVLTSNGEWNWNFLLVELLNDLKNNIINLWIILKDLTNDKSYLVKHQLETLHPQLWSGYYQKAKKPQQCHQQDLE